VSDHTESIASRLAALRERSDPVSEARRQSMPESAWVVEVLEKLRAIVFEKTPVERLQSDIEVAQGLIAGLIGPDKAERLIEQLPDIRHCVAMDVEAAFQGDPAAKTFAEVIAAYPSTYAVSTYRIAHQFYLMGEAVIARVMSEHAHSATGIDIHPGASIGCHFFIDHGTGVVIGETTVIGNRVKMYHGVTLGAFSNRNGRADSGRKRHPTIEDDVTIYPGATILGGETVVGKGSVIGGNTWLTHSVPPNSRVQPEPPALQVRTHDETSRSWDI
jgi:serine O-acetyltransferase